ncbi:hypothetical protein C2S52_007353 [Perilla frutescens var. hirtella]|nr:hypothetical protein C2S52_007353 [Perilla frutescens var. hirtella]
MNIIAVIIIVVLAFIETPAAGSLDLWSGREELVKWAGYGEDKLSTVVIAGTILCNAAHDRQHPVSGARVAVLCGTKSKRKARKLSASSAKGSTDSSGKFLIDLPSHLHAIPNLEKVCHVRVVQLPQTSPCRQACAAKHNKPIHLTSIDQGIRTYTTHNIHLTPPINSHA